MGQQGESMIENASGSRIPAAEPKLILPFLASFYNWVRDLSWPFIRLVLGGLLLFPAIGSGKLTGDPPIPSFAAGLARRGLEPALPLAYLVFFTETVGAVCLILG